MSCINLGDAKFIRKYLIYEIVLDFQDEMQTYPTSQSKYMQIIHLNLYLKD
jgi:hypothetical protein